jgi:hypothetical protein
MVSFENKLDHRIETFGTSGRALVANLLDLAYEYQVPMGIEYLDRDAARRPINLELHNESLRGIFTAVVAQLPEYRVDFSGRVVHIYSPQARRDASNLLNKSIKNYSVRNADTRDADFQVLCALSSELDPGSFCGGSIAGGQWGSLRITLRLQSARVYEILNAIVSENGKAIWTVTVPPEKLSRLPNEGLWHIYPEEPAAFKAVALEKIMAASE